MKVEKINSKNIESNVVKAKLALNELTLKDVANKLNCTKQYVSMVINNKRKGEKRRRYLITLPPRHLEVK
ncbi:MAG: hypothetical protein KAW12_16480 [Candidatus Aminicenantes bacterium]|nr:hypothetical protein [Candidatus Aminicenantes bacterium]